MKCNFCYVNSVKLTKIGEYCTRCFYGFETDGANFSAEYLIDNINYKITVRNDKTFLESRSIIKDDKNRNDKIFSTFNTRFELPNSNDELKLIILKLIKLRNFI